MDDKELEQRYREAWIISRRLSSGIHLGHSTYWPEFNPNRWEVYHAERSRPQTSTSVSGSGGPDGGMHAVAAVVGRG